MSDLHLESFVICDVKGKEWTWANQRGGCHCPGGCTLTSVQCSLGTDGHVEAQAEQMCLGPQLIP